MKTALTARTLVGLALPLILLGCDWFYPPQNTGVESDSTSSEPGVVWTPLEANDAWYERWGGWAAGRGAGTRTAGVELEFASATFDWDDAPDWLQPVNGQQYGACSVFDLIVPAGTTEVADNGRTVTLEHSFDLHLMDCVGEAASGNNRPGLYHMAPVCGNTWSAWFMRAGEMEHETDTVLEASYKIHDETVPDIFPIWFGGGTYDGEPLTVNWAVASGFEGGCYYDYSQAPYSAEHCEGKRLVTRITNEPTILDFELDGSRGVISLQGKDFDAAAEYERRCADRWRKAPTSHGACSVGEEWGHWRGESTCVPACAAGEYLAQVDDGPLHCKRG